MISFSKLIDKLNAKLVLKVFLEVSSHLFIDSITPTQRDWKQISGKQLNISSDLTIFHN